MEDTMKHFNQDMKQHFCITDKIGQESEWLNFLQYKIDYGHISKHDKALLESYINNGTYVKMQKLIREGRFPEEFSVKKIVNKEGTDKKRIVYSFGEDVSITLKFIAFHLHRYDSVFKENCYSFRKNYGVRDALRKIYARRQRISKMYCLKSDIHNYFNSIDTELLLQKLQFIKETDQKLYQIFENILSEKRVWEKGVLVEDLHHGAMAGIPVSPFFANIYLAETDGRFEYYRYSDDLIVFGESMDALLSVQREIYAELERIKLCMNHEKEKITLPGEEWEFLGRHSLTRSNESEDEIDGEGKQCR